MIMKNVKINGKTLSPPPPSPPGRVEITMRPFKTIKENNLIRAHHDGEQKEYERWTEWLATAKAEGQFVK